MDNKEQLVEKYRNIRFIEEIVLLLGFITYGGYGISFFFFFITYDSNQLSTLYKASENILSIQAIVSICLIVIWVWIFTKEKMLKKQLGIEENDQANND